jgi:DNA-binding transcriptional LysR family regulator
VKVNDAFSSNSALALRNAARAGIGIALVPRYSVAADLADGGLVALLPRHRVAQRPLLVVYPRSATVPPKVQVFVDFLRGWVAQREIN